MWRKYGYNPPGTKWKHPGAPRYPPEKECFAYTEMGQGACRALTKTYCRYGKCKFFKTRTQYEREVMKDAVYLG